MRKVRGFKLNLRHKEILRRAKKAKLDLAPQGLGTEPALIDLLNKFSSASKPSVLFDSFKAEATPLSPIPGLAFSLSLATLGPGPADFIEESVLESKAPEDRRKLFEIISQSALDDTTRFVLNLVEDEVKEENCELSPIQYLTDPSALETAVTRLEGHKIGVSATEAGLKPSHSIAFSLSWLAKTRSSRT